MPAVEGAVAVVVGTTSEAIARHVTSEDPSMSPRTAVATLVAVLVAATAPSVALACRCVALGHAQAVARFDVAFDGHAVAQRRGPGGSRLTQLVVDVAHKGVAAGETVEVASERPGQCPVPDLRVGRSYRVYAARRGARLVVGSCNPSRVQRAAPPPPAPPAPNSSSGAGRS